MIETRGGTSAGASASSRFSETTTTNSNLVADAIRLLSQCGARLASVHSRLQVLDVAHRLPCDLVVYLRHTQHRNARKPHSRATHIKSLQETVSSQRLGWINTRLQVGMAWRRVCRRLGTVKHVLSAQHKRQCWGLKYTYVKHLRTDDVQDSSTPMFS